MSERFGFGLISDSVGNNLRNNENDVFAVKNRLARAGVFDPVSGVEPHGFITREMDDGIKAFQRRENLRVDGVLFPGGETESALLKSTSARGLAFAQHTDSGDGEESTEGDSTPVPPVKPELPAQENPPAGEDTKPDRDKQEEENPLCNVLWERWNVVNEQTAQAGERHYEARVELSNMKRALSELQGKQEQSHAQPIPVPSPPKKGRRGRIGMVLDGVDVVVSALDRGQYDSSVSALEKEIEAQEQKVAQLFKAFEDLHAERTRLEEELNRRQCRF